MQGQAEAETEMEKMQEIGRREEKSGLDGEEEHTEA